MPDGAWGSKEPSPLERLVAAREAEKKAQRKKDTRVLASLVVVALVLAGGGVFTWLRLIPGSSPSRHHTRTLAATKPAATTTARSAPTISLPGLTSPVVANGPPVDPFSGTPAEHWANGPAGIVIPAARAHGPYAAAQVRSAYETTRELLIAGNLDWPTLRGGAPKAFEKLLIKSELKAFLAGLHSTKVDKNGEEENTRGWITTFAPGSAKFVTTVVKVHGTMKASVIHQSGTPVLRITVDYIFVYVVEPPGDPADWMRVVQQQTGTVDFARFDEGGGSFEPWYSVSGTTAGVQCATRDGYIHPDYPSGPPGTVPASGKPVNPYSLATPPAGAACQNTTGT
jgi:HAMP domain-containing protein